MKLKINIKIMIIAVTLTLIFITYQKNKLDNSIIVDSEKTEKTKINYDELKTQQLFLVEKKSKWGFIDELGNIIIDINFNFDEIGYYNDSFIEINKEIYNCKGEKIFDEEYEYIEPLEKNYIKINQKEKIVILNIFGEIKEEIDTTNNLKYLKLLDGKKNGDEFQKDFNDGVARLDNSQDAKVKGARYVDFNQEIVIDYKDCIYSSDFQEGLAIVVGVVDSKQSFIPECSKFGYIDTNGDLVIKKNNDIWLFDNLRLYYFYEGLAVAKCNGGWSYINKKGDIAIEDVYSLAYPFNEGVAIVKKDGKYGAIDNTGKIILGFNYELLYTFHNDMAKFYSDGKFGFINKKGEVIIEPNDTLIFHSNFDGGLALAEDSTKGLKGYINKECVFIYTIEDDKIFDICVGKKSYLNYDWHESEYYLDYLENE